MVFYVQCMECRMWHRVIDESENTTGFDLTQCNFCNRHVEFGSARRTVPVFPEICIPPIIFAVDDASDGSELTLFCDLQIDDDDDSEEDDQDPDDDHSCMAATSDDNVEGAGSDAGSSTLQMD